MLRDYKPTQFNVQDSRQVQAIPVAQADTSPAYRREFGDDSWRDKLLQDVMQQGQQVLTKFADNVLTNEYLEGQAAAGVISAEEELQGNPLTRDWKVAGYRDTMGKLALADMQSSFLADLPTLREKGSDELLQYLGKRRQAVLPALAGMSREARASMAGQLLLQDREASRKWAAAHSAYVIEQKQLAITKPWHVTMQSLRTSQLSQDQGSYMESVRSAAGNIVGNVWNSELPEEVKRNLTFEMLQSALANDQVPLYEFVNSNAMPDQVMAGSAEEPSTLISRLSSDQQQKLYTAYREARTRNMAKMSLQRMQEFAVVRAQVELGEYSGTYDDLAGYTGDLVINGELSESERTSLLTKYVTETRKTEQGQILFGALARGDVQAVAASGKSVSEVIEKGAQFMAKNGVPPEQQLATWLTMGRNGVREGYKKAGEVYGTAFRALLDSPEGTVLPQHKATLEAVEAAIQQADKGGLSFTRASVLSGLPESERAIVERYMAQRAGNATVEGAITVARKAAAADAALPPGARAARGVQLAKEARKLADGLEPLGLLESVWKGAKALLGSATAAGELAVAPRSYMTRRDGIFGDSPGVRMYANDMRESVLSEIEYVASQNPSMTADSVYSTALANVSSRTIQTDNGPLFLPRGTDIQTAFGVAPGNQAAIGKAIDGMLKAHSTASKWYMTFEQGRLFAQEYNADGALVGNGMYIERDAVLRKVLEDTDNEVRVSREQLGPGKVVTKDGVSVRFNGLNNAGVNSDWMFGLRDRLIKHEGIVAKPMDDLSGKKRKDGTPVQVVGVAVSNENTKHYPTTVGPDGRITSEQATLSFLGASESAARSGASIAERVGLRNKEGFLLMSELAYQAGNNFPLVPSYKPFVLAMRSKDKAAAVTAFQNTPAYKMSGEERRSAYMELIEQTLRN